MRRKLKQLIKSYFFEIILFFLLIIGLFLLIVDVDLKQNIGVLISFWIQLEITLRFPKREGEIDYHKGFSNLHYVVKLNICFL